MKRFNFKLEKLLNLREFYEKQAELALAHAIAEREAIDLKLKEIAELQINAGKKITSTFDVSDLHSSQNFIIRLNIEKEKLLKELVIADEKVKEKQELYRIALSERKAISKLKEKKMALWKKESLKAEDEFIDDIVSFKYGKELVRR